jgi:A/G-specific adenine glycosylase
MESKSIQNKLLGWFRENKRSLPWRENNNWYHIWISEVMLQQTQVDTVIPYFNRFIERFRTVEQLANASQQEVLKLWEGLGYYSRARNMHKAAKIIVSEYNSQLPADREEMLTIPGFGPYTTHAVLSLAFNQPYAVMDGNVQRVVARLHAITEDLSETKTLRSIQKIMDNLLPTKTPGEFNEAVMELGAIICKSSSPDCSACPVSNECLAFQTNKVNVLPFKSPKPAIPSRQSRACIIFHDNAFLLAKRPQQEMLAGLWEFPVLPQKSEIDTLSKEMKSINQLFNLNLSYIKSWPAIKHTYTHFRFELSASLFRFRSGKFRSDFYDEFQWVDLKEMKKLPLHKAVWKVLNQVKNDLIGISKGDVIDF